MTRLNPASGRGACRGKAPHKPLLLLCLIDMAEAGELTGRTFTRTANLVLRFKEYGALVSERWPTRLDLRMPFFYLGTQARVHSGDDAGAVARVMLCVRDE